VRGWLFAFLFLWTCKGASQGLLIFNNRVGEEVLAPVYDVDPSNPAFAQYGSGFVYNGGLVAGAGFTAQLFGGTTNTALEQLAPLLPATAFRTGAAAGHVVPPTRAVAVPGVPEGERAKVQLRVWNNRDGTITNWQQVLADPTIARGASLRIITPPLGSVFIAPPNLVGLQSFSLALPITMTSLVRGPGGRFRFDYVNPTGIRYCVQASTDLITWTNAGEIGTGSGRYMDAAATNYTRRFYRLVPCG
jgi:hypothetical protein